MGAILGGAAIMGGSSLLGGLLGSGKKVKVPELKPIDFARRAAASDSAEHRVA